MRVVSRTQSASLFPDGWKFGVYGPHPVDEFEMAKRDNPVLGTQARGQSDMKALAVSLVSSGCVLAALVLPLTSSAQVPLVFQTTFADALCPYWDQSMGLNGDIICSPGDGISGGGDWKSNNLSVDQITAAANYPGGGGGKGFRHWRGAGGNNGGGGISISLPSTVTEVWVRFYMRYQLGFTWGGGSNPSYVKDHYWNNLVFGYQGGAWGLHTTEAGNLPSSLGWAASQGGNTGDGQFHCYEYHAKQNGANGVAEIWIDDVLVLSRMANMGTGAWGGFLLGSNDSGTNNPLVDYYTDYDDLAVSTAGRIGCSIVLLAPRNVRVQ